MHVDGKNILSVELIVGTPKNVLYFLKKKKTKIFF